jgi:hypothetical protein
MYIRWKTRVLTDEIYRSDVCCPHEGEGRAAWTPVVVDSRRVAGVGPRQTVLWRPAGSIHSCCVADREDPIARSRWWAETTSRFQALRNGTDRNPYREEILPEIGRICLALVSVVPMPTEEEEEVVEVWNKVDAFDFPVDGRHLGDICHVSRLMTARRIVAERRSRKAKRQRTRQGPSRPRKKAVPMPLRILGVGWPCTRADIVKAYRRGAFEKHPDRGGTNEGFCAWGKAYEDALEFFDAQTEVPKD